MSIAALKPPPVNPTLPQVGNYLAHLYQALRSAKVDVPGASQEALDALDAEVGVLDAAAEKVANKNVAGGYCPLDASVLVPEVNLPDVALTPDMHRHLHHGTADYELWYSYPASRAPQIELVVGADRHYLAMFPIGRAVVLDRIAIRVIAEVDPSTTHAAIYADDGNAYPGDLLVVSDEWDTSTTGIKSTTIDLELDAGLYWLGFQSDKTIHVSSADSVYCPGLLGWKNDLETPATYLTKAVAYGAWPDTAVAGLVTGEWAPAQVFVRLSA